MTVPRPLGSHLGLEPREPARPSATITTFSLFDGDLVNRWFARIGLQSRHAADLAGRCLLVAGVTWVAMGRSPRGSTSTAPPSTPGTSSPITLRTPSS